MSMAQWLILLEILLSSVGYILFFMLIKRAGPVYYSLVGCVVSLTGLFWGWLLFDEQFDLQSSVAIFCILLAITLITLKPTKK
jgi:drug/metabolite transporter (DMT)-like permease